MRWLPQSLFGRTILIMVGGILLAQAIAMLFTLRDRDRMFFFTAQEQFANRVGAMVRVLDPLSAEERERVLPAFEYPFTQIAIEYDNAFVEQKLEVEDSATETEAFASFLLEELGEAHAVQLSVIRLDVNDELQAVVFDMKVKPAGRPDRPKALQHTRSAPPHKRAKHIEQHKKARALMSPVKAMQVQVQLSDGAWLNVEQGLPEVRQSLPMSLLNRLAIVIALIVGLSLLAVGWVTKPLRHLACAAEKLGRDIQSPPLQVEGPKEVRQAVTAFNTMQRRLGRFIQDRTQILAAVSHDLKTPITRLRLRTELLKDEAIKTKYRQDLDDMEHMVTATLDFMQGAEETETTQPINITALLESLQEDLRALGQDVAIQGEAGRPYPGRALALKRCLSNLIENAVNYGKDVRVSVQDTPEQLTIVVSDNGPGIPAEELARVFEPFYRVEASRSRHTGGTGLGLSIARNIARAHGGELTLTSAPGKGVQAHLVLPR